MWQAGRASTAAPAFFDEYSFEGQRFMDGGITLNNPVSVAHYESKRIWGDDVDIDMIVSIGTGTSSTKPSKKSLKDTIVSLVNFFFFFNFLLF